MASSSTTSISKPIYRTKCDCGDQLQYSVSRTDKNPGRKFKACPNYKLLLAGYQKRCKYFKWLDTEEMEFYANEREPYNEIVASGVLQVIKLLKFVLVMLVVIGVILLIGIVF
ncbi:uncharacterized protein LOC128126044 [Lactuca sativa]|uniref:GRF-type domain-containing protein n=1 Tax=Lactuca sativa TaxID=4236 RepID=A0A9R1VG75_LACSA|nr:uncharacterized protein LOC128126044 [Lactuca sativa]KAJ0205786.1 hypothetical protein LSAT_V11C500279210 [Lactuca sativa]